MRRAMRRWWPGILVAAAVVAVLAELKAQQAQGDDTLVLAADDSLGQASRTADKWIARRLLALQFTFVDEDGKVYERKDFLADLKGLAAADAASDATVKIYGRVAMVTGHRQSALGNDVFFLDVWAKQKGAWRALVMQDVVLAAADAPANNAVPDGLREIAKFLDCKNPCETIPYRVRSPAEQDVVNTFQAIEKATFAHQAGEYAKHLADEFVHYRSGSAPVPKAERVAFIEDEKKQNIPAVITSIQSMRLDVYGDAAAMTSTDGVADDAAPLLRLTRVWVRRNGQWQMAISVRTDVK